MLPESAISRSPRTQDWCLMSGQCKLCLQDPANLQNSNGIPAGIYKILRDSDEKNPNPWLLTPTATVQTSRQMTAPMIVTVRRAAPIGVLDTPAVILAASDDGCKR